MIALKITEVKNFMNQFLCQEVFDHFLLQEAVIQTNALYHIDGTVQKEFYTNEEMEELALNGLPFLPIWHAAFPVFRTDPRQKNTNLF